MNYRIVETRCEYPDVLLFIDITDLGDYFVTILAIGSNGETEDYYAKQDIEFKSISLCRSFIEDFSQKSAELWCKDEEISY